MQINTIRPVKVFIKDYDKDYDPASVITNAEITTKNGKDFTEDGLFSSRIFGNTQSFDDYTCKCGTTRGEYLIGTTCKECDTLVIVNPLSISKEGWIDLGTDKFINPFLYSYISSVIGQTALNKMLDYKPEVSMDGNLIEVPLEYPYVNIGISRFIDNFKEIFTTCFTKKKKHENKYNIVMENYDKLFITKFNVKNKRLRPAMLMGNAELTFDVINNYYTGIISNSNTLKALSVYERNPLMVERLKFTIQENINQVYTTTIENLSGKNGQIRNNLLGNRFDYSSRMVITPLDGSYEVDDIVLPYNTALELLKPVIINMLTRVYGYNYIKASRKVTASHRKFDQQIYNIMCDIIKDPHISIMMNRNPTINIGSMVLMRIAEIKKDLTDKTASVHNLILKPLNGDYDGDVLNFVLIYGYEYKMLMSKFLPSRLMRNVVNGKFNRDFSPDKDTLLGLYTLFD